MDHNNFYHFIDTKNLSLHKSIRPKNSLNNIFKSIIAKIRQIQLQIFCYNFHKKTKIKKMSSKLKIAKSFIIYKTY